MADIRYRWAKNEGSVGIVEHLELPQFRLLGHRQKMSLVTLSTGKFREEELFFPLSLSLSLAFLFENFLFKQRISPFGESFWISCAKSSKSPLIRKV